MISMTNDERVGRLSNNKDQLFNVEITVTESQIKKPLNIHFERKKKRDNCEKISSFEIKLSIPVRSCTVCCTEIIHLDMLCSLDRWLKSSKAS